MCLGNFDCCALLCGYEVPAVIVTLVQTSPLVLWRNRSQVTPWAIVRGGWLILRRLARCRHGVQAGTPDPLPQSVAGLA